MVHVLRTGRDPKQTVRWITEAIVSGLTRINNERLQLGLTRNDHARWSLPELVHPRRMSIALAESSPADQGVCSSCASFGRCGGSDGFDCDADARALIS